MQCTPLFGIYDIPDCRDLNGTSIFSCANPSVRKSWRDYELCIDNDVVPKGYDFLEHNCCSGLMQCGGQIGANETVIGMFYDLNAGAGREASFSLPRFVPQGVTRALDMSSTSSKYSLAALREVTFWVGLLVGVRFQRRAIRGM